MIADCFAKLGSIRHEPSCIFMRSDFVCFHNFSQFRVVQRAIPADTLSLMTCNLAISQYLLENKNLDSILQHDPCPNYLPHSFSYTQIQMYMIFHTFIALD